MFVSSATTQSLTRTVATVACVRLLLTLPIGCRA